MNSVPTPMSAPQGNKNAAKPEDQKAGDFFSLRAPSGLKGLAVRKSRKDNKKLSEWLVEAIELKADGPYHTDHPIWTPLTEAMNNLDDKYLDVFGQKGIYAHHRISVVEAAPNSSDAGKHAVQLHTARMVKEENGTLTSSGFYFWLHPSLIEKVYWPGSGHSKMQLRLDYPHA